MTLIWTNHAIQRWAERFPNLLPYGEWKQATERKPSKRLLNQLRKHTAIVKGHRYRISPAGVVFVVAGENVIVTCFAMNE